MGKIVIITLWIVLICAIQKESPELNYLNYHKEFAKIEELIVNEKFESAELSFAKLFEKYDIKFAKDLVIAAQISVINNNKEKALTYIIAASKKGVKIECLKSIVLLRNNISISDWRIIEEQDYVAKKEYFKSIDIDLYQELHKRYQEEQDSKNTNIYKRIVSLNFNRIKKFLDEDQFLGEEVIGVDNDEFAHSLEDCEYGDSRVIVTLLHYDYPISEIGEKKFVSAIEKGELHPRDYARIYNFEKNKISVLYEKSNKVYPELPDYYFNLSFGKKIKDLERVNSDRMKFGICKYGVDIKKEEISQKYGMKLKFNYK